MTVDEEYLEELHQYIKSFHIENGCPELEADLISRFDE